MKKCCSMLLLTGLISLCLLTACGTSQASAADLDTPFDPSILPLGMGEAPISVLSSPRYPDAIRANFVLKDLTDEADYDLTPDGFTVCSGHDYQLVLTMYSEGNDIEDIELKVEEPKQSEDGSRTVIYFYASNRTTTQTLMIARIFVADSYGGMDLELSDTSAELCADGTYIGDITDTPIEIIFEFHVP